MVWSNWLSMAVCTLQQILGVLHLHGYLRMTLYLWWDGWDVAFHHHTPPSTSWQIHFCKLPVYHISAREFLSQTYPLLMPKFIRLTCSWTNHWSREAVLTQDIYDKVRMGGWACIRRSTYYVDTPHNPWQPARKWLHPCHTNHGRPSKNFPMKGSVQESEIPLICYVQYSLFCPCISYGCIMLDYAQHSPTFLQAGLKVTPLLTYIRTK